MIIRTFVSALFFFVASVGTAAEIPARPLGYLHDPGAVLPLNLSKSLSRVLEEHEALSRESFFVVISTEKKEDLDTRAREIFDEWKRETRDPTSAVLLYLQLEDQRAELKAGVGMEAFLSAFPLERMTRSVLRNELSFRSPQEPVGESRNRAVILSVLEVLRSLESPLLDANQAQEIFREGGFRGAFVPREPRATLQLWPFALAAGLLGFFWIMWVALTAEAHYSGEGWVRVQNWLPRWMARLSRRRGKAPPLLTGGGVSGNY